MGIDRVGLLLDVNGQCDLNGWPSDVVGAGRACDINTPSPFVSSLVGDTQKTEFCASSQKSEFRASSQSVQ
jgi:hypothetical protein